MKAAIPLAVITLLAAAAASHAQSVSGYAPIAPSYYVAGRDASTTYGYVPTTTYTTSRYAPTLAPGSGSVAPTTRTYPLYESAPATVRPSSTWVATANYQVGPTAASPTATSGAPRVASQPAPYYTQPQTVVQPVPVQVSAPVTIASAGQLIGDPCACSPVAATSVYYPTAATAPAAPGYSYAYGAQPHYVGYAGSSQLPPGHVFGRGVLLQPVLYVPGQPVRNFFRWLTP